MKSVISPSIEIVTPAPPGSLHGNRMTALRWQGFLKKLGYPTRITENWSGTDCDVLIALHALRSHASIQHFKQAYPHRPIILMMTGTDLYRDLAVHAEVLESMQWADQIVLLQPAARDLIPIALQSKTRIIYQSVKTLSRKALPKKTFDVCVIGHLRPEKDPFRTAACLSLLLPESKIRLRHLGKAMSTTMAAQALTFTKESPRYQWLGERSHAQTLQILSRSHLMVISSLMEGGAHVVSEAIAIGVPVIASDIAGNRGLLGDDYGGYFPVGCEQSLAALLTQAENDPLFYKALEKQVQKRSPLVTPTLEQDSIDQLLTHSLKHRLAS